eukprot:SAG31_NODE_35547_length_322_cov_0.681614_1_plen_54_part_10
MLNLSVSDQQKQLLLNNPRFVTVLADSLLLDPQQPRRHDTGDVDSWDAVKGAGQ